MNSDSVLYVGIDVHRRSNVAQMMGGQGQEMASLRFANNRTGAADLEQQLAVLAESGSGYFSECASENIVKNGHDYKGAQKYHCYDCDAYGTWDKKNGLDERTKQQATDAYLERMSMRGMERVFTVSRKRLSEWLIEEAESLPSLSSTLAEAQENDTLELDEMWSFVLKKSNKRWIWLALCRRTCQIVAYVVGDRSEYTCRKLWERIPAAYRTCQSYSDFWDAYQKVFPEETHQSVGKDSGETNHIERWNNTLRQRLGRFVRKTLSFSKSDYFHEIVLRIFIFRYNLLTLKAISQT